MADLQYHTIYTADIHDIIKQKEVDVMRVNPTSIPPIRRTYVTTVTPVQSATNAPQSGIRPHDLAKMLKNTYNSQGNKVQTTDMVRTFADLFTGAQIDTKA